MDGVKTSARAIAKIGAKTRALKKYEAAPVPYGKEQGNPPLDLFSPFGPMIALAEMPQVLIDKINGYADRMVGDDAGAEFLLPKELVAEGGENSLVHQTESVIRRYLPLVDEEAGSRIRIDVFWIVSQRAGTPSPVHFHSCDISGVLYLKVPEIDREDEELQKTLHFGTAGRLYQFLDRRKATVLQVAGELSPARRRLLHLPGLASARCRAVSRNRRAPFSRL